MMEKELDFRSWFNFLNVFSASLVSIQSNWKYIRSLSFVLFKAKAISFLFGIFIPLCSSLRSDVRFAHASYLFYRIDSLRGIRRTHLALQDKVWVKSASEPFRLMFVG